MSKQLDPRRSISTDTVGGIVAGVVIILVIVGLFKILGADTSAEGATVDDRLLEMVQWTLTTVLTLGAALIGLNWYQGQRYREQDREELERTKSQFTSQFDTTVLDLRSRISELEVASKTDQRLFSDWRDNLLKEIQRVEHNNDIEMMSYFIKQYGENSRTPNTVKWRGLLAEFDAPYISQNRFFHASIQLVEFIDHNQEFVKSELNDLETVDQLIAIWTKLEMAKIPLRIKLQNQLEELDIQLPIFFDKGGTESTASDT